LLVLQIKNSGDVGNCNLDVDGRTVIMEYTLDSLANRSSFANVVSNTKGTDPGEGTTGTPLSNLEDETRFIYNVLPGENITITQGNAKDLSAFSDNTYDMTLILGPMYHLFTEEDKLQALSEAIRVTRKGGLVFAAYCMGDASIVLYGFRQGQIHNIIDKCMLDPVTFETFSQPWDLFELHRKEDIDALRSRFDVTQLHFLATDGYANHMRQTLAEMDEATFQLFLRYHFATCERLDLVGYSNHTLDIFRKD
jgi:SAM-dependent methyltransferase